MCTYLNTKPDEFALSHNKSERSVQVYLLLQELGLPQDLAWPIAAAAYWLL